MNTYYHTKDGDSKYLISISDNASKQLYEFLEKSVIPQNSCWQAFQASVADEFDKKDGKTYTNKSLVLKNIIFRQNDDSFTNYCSGSAYQWSALSQCFANIREGKCKCPVISQKIGKLFYPGKYK